jgi:hypothetical protein
MMAVRSLVSCFLAAFAVAVAGVPGKASAQDSPVASLIGEVGLAVDSVEIVEGEVVANAVLTLEIADRILTQEIPIPLEVGALPGAEGECDILTLSLEPVDQNLAGLTVELDNCAGGPVMVLIQPVDDEAIEGDSGELLCDVATALLDGVDLESILAALPAEDAAMLNLTLADVLDQTFVALLEQGVDDSDDDVAIQSSGKSGDKGKGKNKNKGKGKGKGPDKGDDDDNDDDSGKGSKRVELAEFHVDGLVGFDVSGQVVDTTDVCLEIYAEGGKGNLLGNMLRQLDHLMSRPGNTAKAQKAILKNLRRALSRLETLSL